MNQTTLNNFWEILNMMEDYCSGGYRQEHPPAPDLQEQSRMPAAPEERGELLIRLHAVIAACTNCNLCMERKNAVYGEGPLECLVFVIGDTPDALEETLGKPFAGQSGQYLDKWLNAIQLERNGVTFLSNLVKCRPRDDRMPEQEEIAACFPYLETQLRIVKPAAILCTGLLAARLLTGESSASLESLITLA